MVIVGLDLTLYPISSKIEFDNRDDSGSQWIWHPGFRPDENGENGGTLIISPYISVNF